jgi:DNA-binding MarR family transcriptional regulator
MSGTMPFGLKFAIINRSFEKKLDEKASAMGLTAVQLRVLATVSRLEASGETEIHQNDLERIHHVSHPAMTKLLQRMESKGFVRCVPGVQDRRYKNVSSTERSAGIHKTVLAYDDEAFSELCKNFTESQKESFRLMTDMIIKNIDSE